MNIEEVLENVFDLLIDQPDRFDDLADIVLQFQRSNNEVYNRYCNRGFYHLPIEAFKYGPITSYPPSQAKRIFESSGTGRGTTSRHYVRSLHLYERSILQHFRSVFGAGPFTFVAHLPHYVDLGERSSLLYMVSYLVETVGDEGSVFFLDEVDTFLSAITYSVDRNTPFILFGTAFGLLDLIEKRTFQLPSGAIIIETGGMKTYRKEVKRGVLHRALSEGFGIPPANVRSEYGMCELLSQCYTRGGDVFFPPPWMRFSIVDPENPRSVLPDGVPGALAVIDLANFYTVSPILTEDRAVGRGSGLEVLGRLSTAELRGCNFLLDDVFR